MAYTMIHLEVAYRLLDKYKWISNYGDFMLGHQKIHILFTQYKEEKYDITKYRYCTEKVITSFMEECVDRLSGLLII